MRGLFLFLCSLGLLTLWAIAVGVFCTSALPAGQGLAVLLGLDLDAGVDQLRDFPIDGISSIKQFTQLLRVQLHITSFRSTS